MIELTKDYIENLKSIIEAKDDAKAQEVLHELYPADIAELYQELNLQEAIYLYLLMDRDKWPLARSVLDKARLYQERMY